MAETQQHPIENLMLTAMTSLESMVDVNTIIGDIVTSPDGTVIIPVSKVNFGFAAGGSEFNNNNQSKNSEGSKLPFGGGSGAGVNISPMAFLVVKDGNTKLLTLNGTTTAVDKLIDLMPDVINKANSFLEKSIGKTKNKKEMYQEDEQNQYDDDDQIQEDDYEDEDDNES